MSHVFDPAELQDIVKRHVDLPIEQNVRALIDDLVERYGDQAIDDNGVWMFSNAGGIMGTMTVLHASLKEYLLIFGTPHGSEGHSGRHACELWDIVMQGELSTYQEYDLVKKDLVPGDISYLPKWTSNSSRMGPSGSFMLEYCRGPIPLMLPFGLLDSFTSTLDFKGIATTFKVYTRLSIKSLLASRKPPSKAEPRVRPVRVATEVAPSTSENPNTPLAN